MAERVELSLIRTDGGTQPRAERFEDHDFMPIALGAECDPNLEVVYVLQAGSGGPVKIGRTTARRLGSRIAEIQTGQHLPIKLIGAFPGGGALEAHFHRRLQDHHIRGEWFSPVAGLLVGASIELARFSRMSGVTVDFGRSGSPPIDLDDAYVRPTQTPQSRLRSFPDDAPPVRILTIRDPALSEEAA